jgi:hypothetical protein
MSKFNLQISLNAWEILPLGIQICQYESIVSVLKIFFLNTLHPLVSLGNPTSFLKIQFMVSIDGLT